LPFTINDETFFFFFTEAKVVWVNLIIFCQLWQIALAFRWRVQRRIFIFIFKITLTNKVKDETKSPVA